MNNAIVVKENCVDLKISSSGKKVTVVPVLLVLPIV